MVRSPRADVLHARTAARTRSEGTAALVMGDFLRGGAGRGIGVRGAPAAGATVQAGPGGLGSGGDAGARARPRRAGAGRSPAARSRGEGVKLRPVPPDACLTALQSGPRR